LRCSCSPALYSHSSLVRSRAGPLAFSAVDRRLISSAIFVPKHVRHRIHSISKTPLPPPPPTAFSDRIRTHSCTPMHRTMQTELAGTQTELARPILCCGSSSYPGLRQLCAYKNCPFLKGDDSQFCCGLSRLRCRCRQCRRCCHGRSCKCVCATGVCWSY
jgi:hypothetical protein